MSRTTGPTVEYHLKKIDPQGTLTDSKMQADAVMFFLQLLQNFQHYDLAICRVVAQGLALEFPMPPREDPRIPEPHVDG